MADPASTRAKTQTAVKLAIVNYEDKQAHLGCSMSGCFWCSMHTAVCGLSTVKVQLPKNMILTLLRAFTQTALVQAILSFIHRLGDFGEYQNIQYSREGSLWQVRGKNADGVFTIYQWG